MSKLWVSKCWRRVEDRLKNRDHLYYTGATLFIDFMYENQKCGGIGLNIEGTGFIFGPDVKNGKVYLPDHIIILVQQIYKEKHPQVCSLCKGSGIDPIQDGGLTRWCRRCQGSTLEPEGQNVGN